MKTELMRMGLRELTVRWRTTVGMIAAVGIALLVFLALESIATGAEVTFASPATDNLIVQQKGAFGEFSGSRLPGEFADRLRTLGAGLVAGEIRTAAGASLSDIFLIRGIPLDSYATIERFEIVSGAALAPGDEGAAMIGESVLRRRGWNLGESIVVQEHTFVVKGVFRTGTVADNEVWVPLAEAQRMFGFEDDVSIYVLRGDEHLAERIENELPVEVTRQGEAFEDLVHSLDASVRLLRAVSVVMGIAAGLSILTVMFTMARTRRREMAILRTIGFARRDLIPYLVVPAITVTTVGYVVALIAALLLIRALNVGAFGITVTPVLDQRVAMIALLWSLGIGVGAAAYPTAVITGIDMAGTLRAE